MRYTLRFASPCLRAPHRGLDHMRDEDRTQPVPLQVRGAVRAGPRPSASPVLSADLRQRLLAAVVAGRAAAAPQDDQAPAEPSPPGTRSGPAGSG